MPISILVDLGAIDIWDSELMDSKDPLARNSSIYRRRRSSMDFEPICTQAKRIPIALAELGTQIETVSNENDKREEFYNWYNQWYSEAESVIAEAKECLKELEQSALCSGSTSLEQRHAVKEAIDLEPLVESIGSQLSTMASSVDQGMRFGHIWKIWSVNIQPSCKRLELAIRKFCVASAGL